MSQKAKTLLPLATLALVGANLAVAFVSPYVTVLETFAFDPRHPKLLTVLTSLFLHDPANIVHLLGNMVFLASVGPLVESSIGALKAFLTYIVAGVFGVCTYWAMAQGGGSAEPLIGASGAVAGCVGYCAVRFARRRAYFAPNVTYPVSYLIGLWFVLQAVGVFVHFAGAGGTAFAAHVGGFLGGVILAFVFRARREALIEEGHQVLRQMDGRSPAAALDVAVRHLDRHPGDVKALWVQYEASASMGETGQAVGVLLSLLSQGEDQSKLVRLLSSHRSLDALTPIERMRIADQVDNEARRLLWQSVAQEPDDEPERPNALLALADAAQDAERRKWADELTKKYALHPATESARARGLL